MNPVLLLSGEGAGDVARKCYSNGWRVLAHEDNVRELYSDGTWWVQKVGDCGSVRITCRVQMSVMDKIVGPCWSPADGDWAWICGEYAMVSQAPAPGLLAIEDLIRRAHTATAEWQPQHGYWLSYNGKVDWK